MFQVIFTQFSFFLCLVHRIKETNKQREASSNGKSNGSTKAGTKSNKQRGSCDLEQVIIILN